MAGGDVKWPHLCGKIWKYPQKLNTELPFDPVIALLGIHVRGLKMCPQKTRTWIFIAALFVIAKK